MRFLFLLVLLASSRSFAIQNTFLNTAENRHPPSQIFGPLAAERAPNKYGNFEVGLYVDAGTWDVGREHMKLFMKKHGIGYISLKAKDILAGALSTSGIKMLMMPGGESWTYLKDLGETGGEIIKKFVQSGGSYFGVCAGAFYAVRMRDGGYATGKYGIGLLDGTAYDGTAYKTEPFIEGMMDFDFFVKGFNSIFRIVLFGGPSFRFSSEEQTEKKIEVLSEFQKIHEPAMILYRFGQGKVFLSGPHLEVEESLVNWGEKFFDPDSEWPIMYRITQFLLND